MDDERTASLEEIRRERIAKGEMLVAHGEELYPATVVRTHTLVDVRAQFAEHETAGDEVAVCGRVLSVREHGGVAFFDLFDGTDTMQACLKKDEVGEERFVLFHNGVDRGDFLSCRGVCFTTKRGEQSVLVREWHMAAKSILPIPVEHFGLKDEDERYRKRYLEMLVNPQIAERVRRRSLFWNTLRQYLLTRGFIEVETPTLETKPGGAEARPFITHHNALDIEVHLRICAGELWQKKLMVGGLPKTFEIGRVFRNEGMSAEHAQDYTQLEFYEAYGDFEKGKAMVRDMYRTVAQETFGTTAFSVRGMSFDLASEWQTYHFCDLLHERYGFDPRTASEEEVLAVAEREGCVEKGAPRNKERATDALWKKIRGSLAGPGFLVGVPTFLEPLAKRDPADPNTVLRFQVVLAGSEVGKGFGELNDPLDQRERFMRQETLRKAGDEEAQFADTEFVEALEYGMPPTFGFGVSERLFSFLEGVSIREAQIFPLMRPK